MNNLFKTLLIASLTFGSYSAFAGNSTNTEDSQEGLIQDESGVSEQSTETKSSKSTTQNNKNMSKNKKKGTTKGNKLQPSNTKDAPPVSTK